MHRAVSKETGIESRRSASPASFRIGASPAQSRILDLQRIAGNRAVVQALQPLAIQRSLKVGTVDYTLRAQTEKLNEVVDEVYTEIELAVVWNTKLFNAVITNETALKAQLTKWIEHKPGLGGKHPIYGRKAQFREYDSFQNLALGLLGWVEAKPGRHDEKTAAEEIYANPAADALLSSLMTKLHSALNDIKKPDGQPDTDRMDLIREQLSADLIKATSPSGKDLKLGTYRRNRTASTNPKVWRIGHSTWEALQNPDLVPFNEKVLILHDLMEYLTSWTTKSRTPQTAGSGLIEEVTDLDWTTGPGGERATTDRGMGLTSSTRDETNPGTRFAREHKIPVWASQSYTTARMLKMAEWAGADKLETASLAWSIFAFWRKEYNHTSIAYHTLHEVMDAAFHWGVEYDPLDRFAGMGQLTLDRALEAGIAYIGQVHDAMVDLQGWLVEHEFTTEDARDTVQDFTDDWTALNNQAQPIIDRFDASGATVDDKKLALKELTLLADKLRRNDEAFSEWLDYYELTGAIVPKSRTTTPKVTATTGDTGTTG